MVPTVREAIEVFKTELAGQMNTKPHSRGYPVGGIQKLEKTWLGIRDLRLNEVTIEQCREWTTGLNNEIAAQYFNNMVGTLRLVLDAGIRHHTVNGGKKLENPAMDLRRVRIKPKDLKLPEAGDFRKCVSGNRHPTFDTP